LTCFFDSYEPCAFSHVVKSHPAIGYDTSNEAEQARGDLVMAGGDAAKPLDHACHALDAIASGVSNLIQRTRVLAVEFPRDDPMRTLQIELGPQLIAVTALVSEPLSRALPGRSQQGADFAENGR
jgi:hypothetical protein